MSIRKGGMHLLANNNGCNCTNCIRSAAAPGPKKRSEQFRMGNDYTWRQKGKSDNIQRYAEKRTKAAPRDAVGFDGHLEIQHNIYLLNCASNLALYSYDVGVF